MYRKTNHNLANFPVATTAHTVTKKDTISNLEYPDWIIDISSHTHGQGTQGQGGEKYQASTDSGCSGYDCGQKAHLATQAGQDTRLWDILTPMDEEIEISPLGDGSGAGAIAKILAVGIGC